MEEEIDGLHQEGKMMDHLFRAWDRKKEQMGFNFRLGDEIVRFPDGNNLVLIYARDSCDFLLYTGLKDYRRKKPKMIFESDLLRCDSGVIFEVKFNDGAFWLLALRSQKKWEPLNQKLIETKELKVVGNIYQCSEKDYVRNTK